MSMPSMTEDMKKEKDGSGEKERRKEEKGKVAQSAEKYWDWFDSPHFGASFLLFLLKQEAASCMQPQLLKDTYKQTDGQALRS